MINIDTLQAVQFFNELAAKLKVGGLLDFNEFSGNFEIAEATAIYDTTNPDG